MAETQTTAPGAIEAPQLPPGTEERVLKELAKMAPDMTITTPIGSGIQETRTVDGELVSRVAVTGAGVPVRPMPEEDAPAAEPGQQETAAPEGAAAGPETTPEKPAAEERATAAAGEQPPAGDAQEQPAAEEPAAGEQKTAPAATPSTADLAELRRRAVSVTAQAITEPTNKPEAEAPPEIDYSDEPNWADGTKFATEAAAEEAKKKYLADKAAEHASALSEHEARQSQRTEQARLLETEHNNYKARQFETAAQIQKLLGMDDAAYRSATQDYMTVRHPNPVRQDVQNPVAQYLTLARDSHLVQRARNGLPIDDQESVAELMSAQFSDLDFARAVAGVVADDATGAIVLTAVAQLPEPVRMLKHLVGEEGQKYVSGIVSRYGDGRQLTNPQKAAVLNEVMMDLIRTDTGLATAPKAAPEKKQGAPAAPAAPPAAPPAAAPAAAAPGPGRFTEREPAAPRSTPAPAHTAPPPGSGPNEAFSDAWIAREVKDARAGKYEHLFNQGVF